MTMALQFSNIKVFWKHTYINGQMGHQIKFKYTLCFFVFLKYYKVLFPKKIECTNQKAIVSKYEPL